MNIYLLRHGDKERGKFFNPALRHQDPPLSAQGSRDALALVPGLTGKDIRAIYVSAYCRTHQTIQPLAEHLHLEPVEDARLNELDNGLLDDMSEQEFAQAYPEEWKAYTARKADFRFPGGETGEEARARVADFLEEKRCLHTDGNILAVSHDGLIRVCMCHVLGVPVFHRADFKVDLCGLTEIVFQEEVNRWRLIRFNQSLLPDG